MKVAVVGAGIAGTAAAHELARLGARPTVFHLQAGASALYSGALDFEAWDRTTEVELVEPELAQFASALGVWELGAAASRIATAEGNVRPARGRDQALLDLEHCAGKRIAVVDPERDDWDAELLARSFASNPWSSRTKTTFEAVRVRALQSNFERRTSAYDFAVVHDAPERFAFLLAALKAAKSAPEAWLFGPWLGIERRVAAELGRALGIPVGETTSAPGGGAGARFEAARDRLLARVAVTERVRIVRIEPAHAGYHLETESGQMHEFSALVLATGGVAAGGVALERSFERRGGTGFRLSFSAPVSVELGGETVEGVSSLSSIDFVERGLGTLLQVGIGIEENTSARGAPGLFVAGDAVAGRPRTALLAARSGLVAARHAHAHARSAE